MKTAFKSFAGLALMASTPALAQDKVEAPAVENPLAETPALENFDLNAIPGMDKIDLAPFQFAGIMPNYSVTITVKQEEKQAGMMTPNGQGLSRPEFQIQGINLVAVFQDRTTGQPMLFDCAKLDAAKTGTVVMMAKESDPVGEKLLGDQVKNFEQGAKALHCPVKPSI